MTYLSLDYFRNFFGRIFREKFCGNGELCVTLQRLRRGAPRLGTTIVLWCNGSTTVFGSVCLGSNPGKTTIREEGNLKAAWFLSSFLPTGCLGVLYGTISGGYTGLSRVTGFCSYRPHPAHLFDWYTCVQFLRRLRRNRHQKGH